LECWIAFYVGVTFYVGVNRHQLLAGIGGGVFTATGASVAVMPTDDAIVLASFDAAASAIE
jgi:hypothetical protein